MSEKPTFSEKLDNVFDDTPFQTPSDPAVTTVTTADGAELHLRIYGQHNAETIVLIHGWTCSIEYWYPQINTLSADYRVVTYDQRGHGRSTRGQSAFSTETLADDLQAILEAMPPSGRAVLVGHSMGAITIMAWAAKYPLSVRIHAGAVLLACTGAVLAAKDAGANPMAGGHVRLSGILINLLVRVPVPASPRWFADSLVRHLALSKNAHPLAVAFLQRVVGTCPPHIRMEWARALVGADVSAGLAKLHVPTTVIGGVLDALLPIALSRRIANELESRGSLHRYVELADAGHAANLESPARFDAEIIDLCEQVPRIERRLGT